MQTVRCCRLLFERLDKRDISPLIVSAFYQRNFYLSSIASNSSTEQDRNGDNESQKKIDPIPVPSIKKSEETVDLDYSYFRNIVSDLTKPSSDRLKDIDLSVKKAEVGPLRPALPKKSGNLATYVNESELLKKLVQLGTDLSKVERNREVCNYLLQTDFNTGIQPYLEFLLEKGVDKAELGNCLTKNAALLQENLEDLQVRVNYLESKKFSSDAIARILTKAPLILTQSTTATDAQLGFLQKAFYLTGADVRKVITAYPKLSTWPKAQITNTRFVLKEVCGFSNAEQKTMILFQPKIYSSNCRKIEETFDYLHNKMGFTHEKICQWPQVFRTRLFVLRNRHSFLTSIGRAQYDPKEPNYVSLKMLVSGRDSEFCANVAKVPVQQYNNFLKTL